MILKTVMLAPTDSDGNRIEHHKPEGSAKQKHWSPDAALWVLSIDPIVIKVAGLTHRDFAEALGTTRRTIVGLKERARKRVAKGEDPKRVYLRKRARYYKSLRIKHRKPYNHTGGRRRTREEIEAMVMMKEKLGFTYEKIAKRFNATAKAVEWYVREYSGKVGQDKLIRRRVPRADQVRTILTISPTLNNKQVLAAMCATTNYPVSDVRRRMKIAKGEIERKVKKNENAVQEKRTGRTCCLPFRLFERRIPEGDSRLLKPTGN